MREINEEQVITEIEEAFADVLHGKGVTLHETDVIDAGGSRREAVKARQQDTEERCNIKCYAGIYWL